MSTSVNLSRLNSLPMLHENDNFSVHAASSVDKLALLLLNNNTIPRYLLGVGSRRT
jgi:hypothetical protein